MEVSGSKTRTRAGRAIVSYIDRPARLRDAHVQRLASVSIGSAAFVTAHLIEVRAWHRWFAPGSDFAPWFLNSGRAVAFTAACLFVAGAFISILSRPSSRGASGLGDASVLGGFVAVGAALAMTVVLMWMGPGTLAPIALGIGWATAAASTVSGALVGALIRPSQP